MTAARPAFPNPANCKWGQALFLLPANPAKPRFARRGSRGRLLIDRSHDSDHRQLAAASSPRRLGLNDTL
jgi:hypothetical protein